jgi:predicted NAD/FAD-binding protein
MQKIAIVGSGIAGLTCAHYLHPSYDVHVFEKNNYIGGHTHTVPVETSAGTLHIDTGFIVFNQRTYPHFCQLLNNLGVEMQPSEMSFSYCDPSQQFEYNGHSLNSLFSQRGNLFNIKFYRMLWDILHFNRLSKQFAHSQQASTLTLGEFLSQHNFSDLFQHAYLLPMTAAIWSCPLAQVAHFPMYFLSKFFANHGLLNIHNRPQWYVVTGGSHTYVNQLIQPIRDKIYCNNAVKQIVRSPQGITLHTTQGEAVFDKVILATHSDQALALLANPSQLEQDTLGNMPYQNSRVILHTDTRLLPQRKTSWASWNFRANSQGIPSVTYYMNRLQNLDCKQDYCVSLNPPKIADEQVLAEFSYAHPCYSTEFLAAQHNHDALLLESQRQHTYYAGAYWGNGFHEDGVNSARKVCQALGVSLC